MTDKLAPIAAALAIAEDELENLREAADADPPRGAPLVLEAEGEADLELEPGAWFNCADRLTGLPPACPVIPLGSDGETFYFLNTLGQVHLLKAASSGKGPIDALFQGRSRYLEWAWPRWAAPKGGESRGHVAGYQADDCRRSLFDACAYKGTFELEDRVRGRGAWRDDDGGLIFHAGDAVYIGGRWRKCGEHGRFIYPARPRIARPSRRYEAAGEGSPGDMALQLLLSFNWDRGELDARLMLGWAMTARVGGALTRRPVGMVNGEEGSGKSVLQELLRLLMGGGLVKTANTSQAGIYQRVKQDSVAVMVDENEPDPVRADKLLELARIAYSGDKMLRGGQDGVGKEFALMSSCLFTSIVKPATGPEDDSRMFVGMLRPIEKPSEDGPLDGVDLEKIGAQLLKRWFDWWPRWAKLLKVFRLALIEVGHDSRSCDTFGPLAAGCHVALCDDMPTAEDLAWWKERLAADELTETATKEKTWRRCFGHMLQAQPDVYKALARRSVGEYLEAFKKNPVAIEDCEQRLPHVGLSLSFPEREPQTFDNARLFVPATHPGLHALFEGTNWAGRLGAPGPWVGVLRQMPKALWYNGKCEKGLDKKRSGVFIQLAAALEA